MIHSLVMAFTMLPRFSRLGRGFIWSQFDSEVKLLRGPNMRLIIVRIFAPLWAIYAQFQDLFAMVG